MFAVQFWLVIFMSAGIITALALKIYLMKKSAREIRDSFAEKTATDTNTLIDISSSDRDMRLLADSVNIQLKNLREQRLRYEMGDAELKNAVVNISHDLRTPITAVSGYLSLLEKEEKSETVCRYIDIIKNRTEAMTALTEELLRYSVIVSGENNAPCKLNLCEALEESTAAFYAALTEKHIVPVITMPEKKVMRSLDKDALSRVFANLFGNAVKYSDGDLAVTLTESGKITFENTASALDKVQVGRLFDRFYTVETARRSTGLGLSIAKTLTEQMGGSITADYQNKKLIITIQL